MTKLDQVQIAGLGLMGAVVGLSVVLADTISELQKANGWIAIYRASLEEEHSQKQTLCAALKTDSRQQIPVPRGTLVRNQAGGFFLVLPSGIKLHWLCEER